MWFHHPFFKYAVGVLFALAIILIMGQIGFFFSPIITLLSVLFPPILLSLVLYYILRPILRWCQKTRLPTSVSIILIFLAIFLLVGVFATYSGSLILNQLQQLFTDLPKLAQIAKNNTTALLSSQNIFLSFLSSLQDQLSSSLQKIAPFISNGVISFIAAITNTASILILVPFILFYLLKEDKDFAQGLLARIPEKFRNEVKEIIRETDKTLSTYIIGQAIIAFILGLMMYVGYLFIGLNYSLLLAIFVMITSFVPMFGTVIGVIPGLVVAITLGPMAVIKVLILTILVQNIEGNFISPNLVGKRLSIHPLTIILLFAGATALFGFMGMLLCIPAYAVLKVVLIGGKKIYTMMRSERFTPPVDSI